MISLKKTFIVLLLALFPACTAFSQNRIDVDVGEPLGEALFDLTKNQCTLVSSPSSYMKELKRVDVFRMKNGKYLYVESSSAEWGDVYSIKRMAIFDDIKADSSKFKFFKSLDLVNLIGHDGG